MSGTDAPAGPSGTTEPKGKDKVLNTSFSANAKADKPVTIKLDNIKVLTGQDNYNIWASTMKLVWKGMRVYEIVVEGLEPEDESTETEKTAYESLCHQASAVYIQVVSSEILEKIVELEHPHLMWTFLKGEFYRDTAFTLVSQIMSLVSLPSTYDAEKPISVFIAQFEQEWLRLSNLAKSSTDTYRSLFAQFLTEDKAKRDFLLGFLVRHQKNVVDNLSTKDDFTFAEVKQRLLDLDHEQPSSSPSSQTALVTTKSKKSNFRKSSSSSSSQPKKAKECTWCLKHSPGTAQGHVWSSCFKLKKQNEEQGKGKGKDKESAMVTTDSDNDKVRLTSFFFDTGATSHMCPYSERFENLEVCSGAVSSSSKDSMAIEGKGTVVMDCVLRDGSVSSFRVSDVLFVPGLERPLISWRKLMEKDYKMVGEGDFISIVKGNKTFFEAAFDGSLFKIPEVNDKAFLTFDFWHSALGHLAPSSIDKAKNLYTDASIIPPVPENFHCSACSFSKSVHHTPMSTNYRASTKLELVHSDLCGPFPSSSYGGALYYISFVDDMTRVSWVRFLKKKSDAAQAIEDFTKEMQLQYGLSVKRFRTDNGGEYVNEKLKKFFSSKGIVHELTPPYSPESNGVAERLNRTMGETVRAMLLPLSDKKLWADAVSTFIYLKNRQPHRSVKDQTPYEAFTGNKPSIHHLQPFGQECYVHIPKDKRPSGSKLSPRAVKGIFIGYTPTDKHYRVFIPSSKHAFVSGDVFFPPFTTEGAQSFTSPVSIPSTPITSAQPSPQSTGSLVYPLNKEGFPTEDMWLAWMERNPSDTVKLFQTGHPVITELVNKEFTKGKRDGFLGPQFWNYPAPEPQQQNSPPPAVDPALSQGSAHQRLVRTPSPPPSDHGSSPNDSLDQFRQIQSRHQSVERSPRPLTESEGEPSVRNYPHDESLPSIHSSWRPNLQRTRSGRTVNPPREWWKAPVALPDSPSVESDTPMPEQSSDPVEEETMDVDEPLDESVLLSILEVSEPKTYSEARSSVDWPLWQKAIDEELESLSENNVWEVVDRPTHRKVVDCRWVFKVKGNAKGEVERYKARLVAKGFLQVLGLDYDEIFSPVVRYDSLRLLLAISACKGWRVRQLDVKTAFLYGILKEEVYMQLPEGSRFLNKVARLNRCIYGLKQSPREWYYRLVEYLIPYGFAITVFDPCVLVHESGNLILAIYVDDITLFGPSGDLVDQTVSLLQTEFKVNDMGLLHYLLGIQIDYTSAGITLSQTAFIDKILNRFGMQKCSPVSTPIDSNHRLMATRDEDEKADTTTYQQIIGSLMYLVTATRPDLAYTISHLSQFNSNPSKAHMTAVKRVLRYLQKTKEQSLLYPFGSDLRLSAFNDASHGNCHDTRRSFSGYLFRFGDSTISWRSRKQRSVATSTCEAEYMALAMTTKHHLWLTRGLKELLKEDIPHAIFCDSNSAIDLSNNPKLNDRTKHIDIAYHFTRERVVDGSINLLYVPSADNLADICTKGLSKQTHDQLCT